jgi:3-deoxy-D-manno-octulosonic-acid transferase
LLEPALAGRPVLYGPNFGNQKSGQVSLTRHGMGFQVADADQISSRVVAILEDQQAEGKYSRRSEALRQESASIIDRYVAAILG